MQLSKLVEYLSSVLQHEGDKQVIIVHSDGDFGDRVTGPTLGNIAVFKSAICIRVDCADTVSYRDNKPLYNEISSIVRD